MKVMIVADGQTVLTNFDAKYLSRLIADLANYYTTFSVIAAEEVPAEGEN